MAINQTHWYLGNVDYERYLSLVKLVSIAKLNKSSCLLKSDTGYIYDAAELQIRLGCNSQEYRSFVNKLILGCYAIQTKLFRRDKIIHAITLLPNKIKATNY